MLVRPMRTSQETQTGVTRLMKNWSVRSQFNTLNPGIGATTMPEYNGVCKLSEADARHFFAMWMNTVQRKNRVITLWQGDEVVEVGFAK